MQEQPLSGGKRFVLDWLGPAAIVLLLFIAQLTGGVVSPMFLMPQNALNILQSAAPMIALSLATALVAALSGGIDLSLGGAVALTSVMMGYTAIGGGAGGGLLGALAICALFGALSGFLIVCLRAPSYLVTLLTGGVLRGVAFLISQGQPISGFELAFLGAGRGLAAFLLILLAAGLSAGLYFCVKLLEQKARCFALLQYAGSAVIASLAGYYWTARLMAAQPSLGTGYDFAIVFFWGALSTSRLMGRTPLAFAFALLPPVYYSIITNVLAMANVASFLTQIIAALLALVFLALAYALNWLRGRWEGGQQPLMT